MKSQLDKRLVIAVVGVFLTSIAIAILAEKGDVLLLVNESQTQTLAAFFHYVTDFGDHLAYSILICAMVIVKYRYAIALALNGLLTLLMSGLLKSFFGRPRPLLWLENEGLGEEVTYVYGQFLQPTYDSFPSGHAIAAFSSFGFLALIAKPVWLQVMCLTFAFLIAFSRIYLGFHFLQDVVFGSMVGGLIAYTGYAFQHRYLKGKSWTEMGLLIHFGVKPN